MKYKIVMHSSGGEPRTILNRGGGFETFAKANRKAMALARRVGLAVLVVVEGEFDTVHAAYEGDGRGRINPREAAEVRFWKAPSRRTYSETRPVVLCKAGHKLTVLGKHDGRWNVRRGCLTCLRDKRERLDLARSLDKKRKAEIFVDYLEQRREPK